MFNAEEMRIVRDLADSKGIPQDFALGIVAKESAGNVLWPVGGEQLPSIRIEGHYFYRELAHDPAKQATAVRLGFAAKDSGVVKNPGTMTGRYAKLQSMAAIEAEAAYRSISIGIGQVMGANFRACGYSNAREMFKDAMKGLAAQAEQMLSFIHADRRLVKAANEHDYKTFARIYNGPGYKKNRYDTELAKFVRRYSSAQPVSEDTSLERIKALGYSTIVDFQKANDLEPDGIPGPLTKEALDAAEADAEKAKNATRNTAGKVAAGGSAVVATAAVADQINQNVTSYKPYIDMLQNVGEYGAKIAVAAVIVVVIVSGIIYVREWWKK